MKKNQSGFSGISVLLLLGVVGLIGVTGWYIWQSQDTKSQRKITNNNTITNTQKDTEPLSLTESKIPVGWKKEIKEPGHIFLRNATTKCFTEVRFSTDKAEYSTSVIDKNKQTVDSIKSKGYTVTENKGKLSIVASSGDEQIDSQVINITGQGNPAYQNYAYIIKASSITQIQLSCPNEAAIQTAQTALKAIVLNKL